MCGIAGILHFGRSSRPIDVQALVRMRDLMSHRGPDGSGLWVAEDRSIGLAHCRLAIIDPSPEAGQPMTSDDGRFTLIFNGMIYNHQELRRELEPLLDCAWYTDHSDTEVVLRAWQAWGIHCLQRFRGMYAFAVWDALSKKIWLVRDRMGIKPLHYTVDRHGLRFASEAQSLVRTGQDRCQMNQLSLARFLHFGYIPGQQTAFQDIHRVMPGCWICFDAEGLRSDHRYWNILDHSTAPQAKEGDCVEEIRELLKQSVAEHNASDVPLGLLLSGGVDSSAIAALSVAEAGRSLPSFSIGYDGLYPSCPDETGYARAAAAMAGAEYHQKTISPEEFECSIAPLVAAMGEPFAVYHIPLYAVSGFARAKGIRVLHGGEGADEVFLGYHLFQRGLIHEGRRRFSPLNSRVRQLSAGLLPPLRGNLAWHLPAFYGTREGLNLHRLESVLGPGLLAALKDSHILSDVAQLFEEFLEKCRDRSVQQWMSFVDMHMRMSSSLLPKWDIVTMQHGIECRVPFLDHRIVERVFSMPGGLKMRTGESKRLLKQAVRHLIPEQVVKREKQGLFAPFREWFLDGLGQRMHQSTLDFAKRTGLLIPQQVNETFRTDANRAWYLYTFALWHKHYLED